MFNKLTVEYYGAPTPLQQLASFQTPEARTILVIAVRQVGDGRDRAHPARLRPRHQPQQRRPVIRVNLPMLTEERRREYIKLARTRARTPRSPSATSAARPRRSSTAWSRTARSVRTRAPAPRRSSRPSPRSTSTWSTTCSSTRKPSSSTSEVHLPPHMSTSPPSSSARPDGDPVAPPRRRRCATPRPTPPTRAGSQPAGRHRRGRGPRRARRRPACSSARRASSSSRGRRSCVGVWELRAALAQGRSTCRSCRSLAGALA